MIDFKEHDLVMVRLPNEGDLNTYRKRYYNVWLRVAFIDNDNTFIGYLEKKDKNYTSYEVGAHIKLNCYDVQRLYHSGETFCYSDDVTICECPGVCRNK